MVKLMVDEYVTRSGYHLQVHTEAECGGPGGSQAHPPAVGFHASEQYHHPCGMEALQGFQHLDTAQNGVTEVHVQRNEVVGVVFGRLG
jgi:hypothetical protein